MDDLLALFKSAKIEYDQGGCPLELIRDTGAASLLKLKRDSKHFRLAKVGTKNYFGFKNRTKISRPCLEGLFCRAKRDYESCWDSLIGAISQHEQMIRLDPEIIDKALYTTIMAFSVCFDLWKTSSRKTPGTLLEIILGSTIGSLLPDHDREKQVIIPDSDQRIPTDIVFVPRNSGPNLVIPAKITTRERIVQPFAHQRILDSVFGKGEYISSLMCVSEMQRDRESGAHEVCVPGTILLFQQHLATLEGIYYLDPPTRYLCSDVTEKINIQSIGTFLSSRLPQVV